MDRHEYFYALLSPCKISAPGLSAFSTEPLMHVDRCMPSSVLKHLNTIGNLVAYFCFSEKAFDKVASLKVVWFQTCLLGSLSKNKDKAE